MRHVYHRGLLTLLQLSLAAQHDARQHCAMKFIYVRARNTDGLTLDKGGLTIAVQQRSSDGRLLVAMAKCPDHKLFDEAEGRAQAGARLNSECYVVMTVEALANYIKEPLDSLKAALVSDTSEET